MRWLVLFMCSEVCLCSPWNSYIDSVLPSWCSFEVWLLGEPSAADCLLLHGDTVKSSVGELERKLSPEIGPSTLMMPWLMQDKFLLHLSYPMSVWHFVIAAPRTKTIGVHRTVKPLPTVAAPFFILLGNVRVLIMPYQ